MMTKREAALYKKRWELVNSARIQEVRRMSNVEKLRDLEMLYKFGERLGWSVPTGGEGWEYWRRLKEVSNV
jgi:hypothetical protein